MHEFRRRDFVGGRPVIDFVNTVTARNGEPVDWLESYAALQHWAAMSALDLRAAPASGPEAVAELHRCTALREAVHAVLTAVIDAVPVPSDAAATVEFNWREAAEHARLDVATYPFVMRFDRSAGPDHDLTRLRRRLAVDAVDLLTHLPRQRLRRCPGPRCGWLFLDSSKAGRRRWCDMTTCGTHDKNRRRQRTLRSDADEYARPRRVPADGHGATRPRGTKPT
ncbi:CGNR zinc finger domain-containing protein [Dactylosporangium vinaceum]|uniref:CGNR zinc finger domain-containing protein n=1 Tax=Dactylosporangium vinaceum TaxID=53362 RepID=A0ABV5M9F8_9ACTN|nr:ABATE domain-containing protein [Dactylosporangium vinaceum]UAB99988.1 CGNR zinc finger domain-containing protein [Dactylosporangium vinaceum]